MKIYLIGLPGAGKRTIGKLLAKELNYEYVSLEALISLNALMFTDEIIEKYGWDKLYELETDALIEVSNLDNVVIACGDNIVDVIGNKALMDGIVIYLDVSLENISSRLADDFYRDILKIKTLDELSEERFLKHQNFANVIIDNNKTKKDTLTEIMNYLNNIN